MGPRLRNRAVATWPGVYSRAGSPFGICGGSHLIVKGPPPCPLKRHQRIPEPCYASGATPNEIAAPATGRSLALSVKCLGAFPDVASAMIVRAT